MTSTRAERHLSLVPPASYEERYEDMVEFIEDVATDQIEEGLEAAARTEGCGLMVKAEMGDEFGLMNIRLLIMQSIPPYEVHYDCAEMIEP